MILYWSKSFSRSSGGWFIQPQQHWMHSRWVLWCNTWENYMPNQAWEGIGLLSLIKRITYLVVKELKIMFENKKNILKAKNNPSPFHINPLINNTRLSRVVFVLKIFVFALKVIAIVFIIAFIASGLYFFDKLFALDISPWSFGKEF